MMRAVLARVWVQAEEKEIAGTQWQVGVILSIEDYRRILEELEELEAIRAYDEAKAEDDEAIPFEQAIAEIEQAG